MSNSQSSWFEKTDRMIVKIVKAVSVISGICLVGIMLVAFFNVLGEKILHHGVPGSTEIITYLHVPVVFLAAAYVTLDTGHTKIDLLSRRFPLGVQKILYTIGDLVAAVISCYVGYRGFVRTADLISRHTRSAVTGFGFPVWPFGLVFAIGFMLLALTFLWSIVRRFAAPAQSGEGGAEA